LYLPNNDLEKYTTIHDIDNKPKLYKFVREIWLLEREKEKLLYYIENITIHWRKIRI
jgi:hypothetical protein